MRKLLIFTLCGIVAIGLTGCESQKTDSKKNSEKQNVEDKKESGKTVTVTDEMEKLLDSVSIPIYSSYESYYYTNDKITVDDMDNQVKLLIGVNNYLSNKNDGEFLTSMTKDKMKKELEKIFGQNVNYTDENISAGACYGFTSTYDNGIYTFNGGCGGLFIPYYEKQITKAIEYDDKLELFVQAIYVNYDTDEYDGNNDSTFKYVLFDADKKTKIDTISGDNQPNVSNYKDQLSTYKFTFNKDNNNYYFYSVEKN